MVLDRGPHLLLPIVIGQQVRGNQKTGANDKRSARLPGVEVRSVKQIQALLRPVTRIADTWTQLLQPACRHRPGGALGTTLTIGRNRALKQVTVVIRHTVPLQSNKARIPSFGRKRCG